MNSRAPGSGFAAVLRVQLRTGWKALVIWIGALLGGYIATVGAIDGLYSTPEQLATYDATVASDPAMAAINGTPYGADTLGGVTSNEFGFISAIAIPLMGLLLVVRHTRAQEENGMLELLRSRGVGARAPWSAAATVAVLALVIVGAGMALTLIAYGEDTDGAVLYGASIAGLGIVFVGIATFVGQLLRRAGTVTGIGILILGGAYITRAIGDVRDNAWKWLSPLAWQQETRPFTDEPRVWPLLLALGVGAVLIAAGLVLVGGRDLGASMVSTRSGPARASALLRTSPGLALRMHAPSGVAWIAGAFVVAVVFGAFTDDIADAIGANPAMEAFFGGASSVNEAYVGLSLVLVVLMAIGAVGQAIGRVRSEETGGRLEPTLARSIPRPWWLASHTIVMAVFAAATLLAGAAGLQWTAGSEVEGIFAAGAAYLPALLVVLGLAIAVFGALPRSTAVIWIALGYIAFVAILGDTVSLPDWAMAISPVDAVGRVPSEDVSAAAEWILSGIGVALLAVGFTGFRVRNIPR